MFFPPNLSSILSLHRDLHSGESGSGTPARVLEVSYFGHDALVRLELSDGLVVTARPAGFAAPKIGQQILLTVEGPVHAF